MVCPAYKDGRIFYFVKGAAMLKRMCKDVLSPWKSILILANLKEISLANQKTEQYSLHITANAHSNLTHAGTVKKCRC